MLYISKIYCARNVLMWDVLSFNSVFIDIHDIIRLEHLEKHGTTTRNYFPIGDSLILVYFPHPYLQLFMK